METINKKFSAPVKVLLIDDNRDLAQMTGILLKVLGFESQVCHNGKEGIRLAEAMAPDVILLDIDMPVMNGFQYANIYGSKDGARA